MKALLMEACQSGDLDKARIALSAGADPNVFSDEGWSPLHYASENGFEEIISLLVENGADVNAKNSADYTPFQIIMICENYSPVIVNTLIKGGAEVGSPLHESILLRNKELSEDLITHSKYITEKDDLGNTPLHTAVAVNDIDLIARLLDAGAEIDAQDAYDTTPLQEASSMGFTYVASLLLNRGANPEICDYNGRTALTFAAGNAHYETTELLLNANVNINSQDDFGNTALHYAYENEEFEIAHLLMERGASDSLQNEDGLVAVRMTPQYDNV